MLDKNRAYTVGMCSLYTSSSLLSSSSQTQFMPAAACSGCMTQLILALTLRKWGIGVVQCSNVVTMCLEKAHFTRSICIIAEWISPGAHEMLPIQTSC